MSSERGNSAGVNTKPKMLIGTADELMGTNSRLRAQTVRFVLVGLAQGLVFACLLPFLRALLDGGSVDRAVSAALPWFGVAVAALVISAVLLWKASYGGYVVGVEHIADTLIRRLGEHAARLPLGWFTAGRGGRLARVVSTSVQDVMGIPANVLQEVVLAVTTPLTVVVVTVFVDWRMAVAFVVVVPAALLVFAWMSRVLKTDHHTEDIAHAEVTDRVVEFAQAQAVLRSSGRADGGASLDNALVEHRDAYFRKIRSAGRPFGFYVAVVQIGFTVVLTTGAYLALGGSIRLPDVVALLILAVRFVEPVIQAGDVGGMFRIARISLDAIADVLRAKPLPEPAADSAADSTTDSAAVPADGSIELCDVSFGYGDRPVLSGFTLRCAPGTVTALVGPSGSGKTTVTRLVARFWDVDSGAVRIGGADVREIPTAELMDRLSFVFQDVYLFDGSIVENVRLGRPDATDEQVRAAAELARLDEVVRRLPDGWDARVGEGGSRLSGGERQRVSIARALLKDAPIVLLDEATAALDAENEAAVSAALTELSTRATVLVIAHRLSTVAAADQIAVLTDGRVAELGSHAELMAEGGRYAGFWAERDRAAGWRLTAG